MGLIHAEETERIVVMITPTLTLQQNELAEPIGASDSAAYIVSYLKCVALV